MNITDQIIAEIDSNEEWNNKFDRQVALEERMRGMGIDRHWLNIQKAQERGQETSTKSVRRLMNQAIIDITAGIEAFIAEAETGRAGRKHSAYKFIKQIEPEVAALITARAVLDGVARGDRMAPLARRVGMMIEDELAFREFKKQNKNAYDWLVKREEREHGGNYHAQRKVMYHNMTNREIKFEEWNSEQQINLGVKLVEIMMLTTGMVERVVRNVDAKRADTFVVATKETMDWISTENSRCEALSPVYLPTIIPPKPWTAPNNGGYWTPRVRRLRFIKTNSKPYLQELAEIDMDDVYGAVNAMQHTSWRINTRVLELMQTLWNRGDDRGGIPSADDHDLPNRPLFLEQDLPKEEWTEAQMVEFKDWKRKAADIYAENAKLKSQRLQFAKLLMVAEMFADEDEIFFPHQLDFRGRCYAVPMFLNPQGDDKSKGLLEFSNGVAINDEEGRAWLAIHGANCFGYDKDTLEGRVEWIEQRHTEILACAADPLSNRMWMEAGDPFQFFAFCCEWAGLAQEGFGYVSNLPVQMDGSCNGLQNFSAMLLDEIGGTAVNLTPSEKPADVYRSVAELVLKQVEKDALSDDEKLAAIAMGWLKMGVDRKVCKRPVMTLAYGAKQFGFKKQVFDDTIAPAKFAMGADFPWEDGGWGAADYMGALIWDSVGRVVVAARAAMDWLQKAARVAVKEDLPVRWTTPDGLPVVQAYPKIETKRLELTFGGVRCRLNVALDQNETVQLDRSKQTNGISPNWIHSMDASHMRATVVRCWNEGIRSFSLVHDSYGTHAGNAWALADYLREEFVRMYTETDVMEEFKAELEAQLPEGTLLDPLPLKGNLDLTQVLESDFFFA